MKTPKLKFYKKKREYFSHFSLKLQLQPTIDIILIMKGGGTVIDVLREMGMASRALDAMANAEFKKIELARGQFVYLSILALLRGIWPN